MPTVYQLLGFPATGKYTIARAMVEQLRARGEPVALLDNHATANLIWSLVPDARRFDADVMAKMNELRMVLLDAAEELTGPDRSIVFTNFVPAGRTVTMLDRHRDLAHRLGARFVAVVLHCEQEEVLRRIPNQDRADRMKLVDTTRARQVMAEGMSLPRWPEIVELDITGWSPAEAAARVISLGGDGDDSEDPHATHTGGDPSGG